MVAKPDLIDRLHRLGRRHPCLVMAAVLACAVISSIILLSQAEGPVVLYQAF